MHKLLLAALVISVALTTGVARAASTYGGQCSVHRSSTPLKVELSVSYQASEGGSHTSWMSNTDVPLRSLEGFSPADLSQPGVHHFTVVSDAGSLKCTALAGHDGMAGTFDFIPNAQFAQALHSRGLSMPSERDQFFLALSRFRIATLDKLLQAGFAVPSVGELASISEHGISDDYLKAMADVQFQRKTVHGLVDMRDHGVSAEFARALTNGHIFSVSDIIRARDHGLSATYLDAVRAKWKSVSVDDIITLRDHGVSEEYMAGLARIGYRPSVSDIVRMVDHGVSVAFIQRLRNHGYAHLSVDDIIRLRDTGL